MKRKGYTEGIDQIENTPEIAPVEGEYDPGMLDNTHDSQESLVVDEPPKKSKSTPAAKLTEVIKKPVSTPKSVSKPQKRKADDNADGETPAKRAVAAEASGDENNQGEEKFSRSGRAIKPKKFVDDLIGSPKPDTEVTDRFSKSAKSPKKDLTSPTKSDSEPRKMWVKVKNTDDLIEINLDKDRPESFESNEAKIEWEMASARKALKFKKRVESGEFIPPEIKKKLEEK